ncbi:MAG: right-handed parallel beta-helix repeat-containing protein [Planctomycetaceae bacterium]|nr:right-handed parallel beta-helix repeat-containing protein [Planctomycetaceae bacterium]
MTNGTMRVWAGLLAVAIGCTMAATAGAGELYVSTKGADTAAGTKAAPFATVSRAQQEVRKLIAAGLKEDVTVRIAPGVYELAAPLVLGTEDSGTAEHSVTYAADGGAVVISGGRRIGAFKAEGKVWTADVPAAREGKWYFRQLFVNGRRAVRARSGQTNIRKAILPRSLSSYRIWFNSGVADWKNVGDVELIFFGHWDVGRKRLESASAGGQMVALAGPHFPALLQNAAVPTLRAYFENARELLDEPGEWYLDRTSGQLSYMPLAGESPASAEAVAPALDRLVELAGTSEKPVRNVHFRGLSFQHADWAPPPFGYHGFQAGRYVAARNAEQRPHPGIEAALRWRGAEGCSLKQCSVSFVGGAGVDLGERCRGNVIEGCTFQDIGGGAVCVGSAVSDEATVATGNRIEGNLVERCALDYQGAVGIWAGFSRGTVIRHNEVRELPYTGISVGWQWGDSPTVCRDNIIEFNLVHHVMNMLGDGGGIYTLGAQPGSVIRGNVIRDVPRSPYPRGYANFGLYLDQGSKGFNVADNLVYNIAQGPLRMNRIPKENQTWGENVFENGPAPETPAAKAILKKAGLPAKQN